MAGVRECLSKCVLRLSEAVHVLVRIDDRVLPVQPRGGSLNAAGFAVFHHLFEHGELVWRQEILGERLPPTFELLRFVCHKNQFGRRGRCLAEIDWMIKRRRLLASIGVAERS